MMEVKVTGTNYLFRVYTTEYQEMLKSQAWVQLVSDIITSIPSQLTVRSAAQLCHLLSRNRKCVKILKLKRLICSSMRCFEGSDFDKSNISNPNKVPFQQCTHSTHQIQAVELTWQM